MGWADGPWLGFDTESTGVDPLVARLVTACVAFRSTGDAPDWTTTWLTDAGHENIPDEATAIHGITTERAHAEGQPVVDVAEHVRRLLIEVWAEGVPVVGMNVCYDLTLLNAELVRAGHDELTIDGPVLDPLVIDRAVDKYRRGSRRLPDLCAHYKVAHTAAAPGEDATLAAGAHDATADALAAMRVLWRIGQTHPNLAALELSVLHEQQVIWQAEWAEHFSDYLARQGKPEHIDPSWPIRRLREGASA